MDGRKTDSGEVNMKKNEELYPVKNIDELDMKKVHKLLMEGNNEAFVAHATGVPRTTWSAWKKEYKEFAEWVLFWRNVACSEVERALFQRAKGYKYKETRTFCSKEGIVTQAEVDVQLPPESKACMSYLSNRDKKSWSDKKEVEHSGAIDLEMKVDLDERIEQLIEDDMEDLLG